MIESAARAERRDLQSPPVPCYTWEAPQKPIAVKIPFAMIDRLEHDAVESFRSLSSRGSEIGGILLGSTASGSPAVVTLDDFELIECDYSRGPLYRLSDADMGRFERAIEKYGPRVAGYFRSHTRKGLALDAEDVSFFEPRFLNSYNVALLIRPFATKASVAGIFIREGGRIRGESSPLEFQFRATELGGPKQDEETPQAPTQGAGHVNTPVQEAGHPAAGAPRPVARAQIVPIASRREISLPPPPAHTEPSEVSRHDSHRPVLSPAPAPKPEVPKTEARREHEEDLAKPPAFKPDAPKAETPKPSTPKPDAPVEASKVETPKVDPPKADAFKPESFKPESFKAEVNKPETPKFEAPKAEALKTDAPKSESFKVPSLKPESPKSDAVKPDLPKPAPIKTAASSFLSGAEADPISTPEAQKTITTRLVLVAVALLAIALSGALFVYPGYLHRGRQVATPVDSSPLALRVERTSGGLLLTWNRDAQAIQNANHAVLYISDGDRHENFQMDLSQLRTGSIVYPPISQDVSFRMEVTGKDQAKVTSESLRVLETRPSPLAEEPQPVAQPATPAGTKTGADVKPPVVADSSQPAAPAPAPEEPAVQAPAPTKPFNQDSLGQRLRPVRSTDLPEAPTFGGTTAQPGNLSSVGSVGSMPAPPPPPPTAASAPPPAEKKVIPSGGKILPAQLIYRKDPEFPKLARQAGAKGIVQLVATIGSDGKVKSVQVTQGPELLRKAAADAVMQWKYKPAMLNGVPVESPAQVVLNFVAEH